MKVSDVLRHKSSMTVLAVPPDATVRTVVAMLSEHRIGALVVTDPEGILVGIVSERDVVRRLHVDGAGVLDRPVAEVMTAEVHTTGPDEPVDALMRVMTERRFRHVPVLVDGALVGLVSIGDVVLSHTGELETERDQLTAYITS